MFKRIERALRQLSPDLPVWFKSFVIVSRRDGRTDRSNEVGDRCGARRLFPRMEGDPSLMPEATNREASEEAPDLCVKRLATAQGAAASFQVIAHRGFSFYLALFCDASP